MILVDKLKQVDKRKAGAVALAMALSFGVGRWTAPQLPDLTEPQPAVSHGNPLMATRPQPVESAGYRAFREANAKKPAVSPQKK